MGRAENLIFSPDKLRQPTLSYSKPGDIYHFRNSFSLNTRGAQSIEYPVSTTVAMCQLFHLECVHKSSRRVRRDLYLCVGVCNSRRVRLSLPPSTARVACRTRRITITFFLVFSGAKIHTRLKSYADCVRT